MEPNERLKIIHSTNLHSAQPDYIKADLIHASIINYCSLKWLAACIRTVIDSPRMQYKIFK
jgi:hypothetical protein